MNTKQFRKPLTERDGHKCVICGYTGHLTVDHIKPLGRGGANSLINVQFLCSPCNNAKASKHPFFVSKSFIEKRNNFIDAINESRFLQRKEPIHFPAVSLNSSGITQEEIDEINNKYKDEQ